MYVSSLMKFYCMSALKLRLRWPNALALLVELRPLSFATGQMVTLSHLIVMQ